MRSTTSDIQSTVDGLQIIQLLNVFGHYHPRINSYPSRGICYGFGYANAFALLLANHQVIAKRADLFSQLNELACKIAEKNLSSDRMEEYEKNIDDYYNILDYMFITIRYKKGSGDLKKIVDDIKQELMQYCRSQQINDENALTHILAYFDNMVVIMSNTITKSSSANKQNIRDLFSLLIPVEMEKNNLSIHTGETLSGVFDQRRLSIMLHMLATEIKKNNLLSPIVFSFSGMLTVSTNKNSMFVSDAAEHTISISFNPKENKWYFIDSMTSCPKALEPEDVMNLAEEIIKEFCLYKKMDSSKITWRDFFIHVLMTDKKELAIFNQSIRSIKQTKEWKNDLIMGCFEQENVHHNNFLIKNCLTEGSAQEIKSFFSDNAMRKIAADFTFNGTGLIGALIHLRYMDENLPSLIKALVESGIRLDSVNSRGRNAIHELIYIARDNPKSSFVNDAIIQSIKLLCENGVDINQHDTNNYVTPLASAVAQDDIYDLLLVKALLENKADPNILFGSNKGSSVMESLVYLYLNPRFSYYTSDETVNNFNQYMISAMKLLIEYGIDLDILINKPYGYKGPVNGENKVILKDYIKNSISSDTNYYSDRDRNLIEVLSYYENFENKIKRSCNIF